MTKSHLVWRASGQRVRNLVTFSENLISHVSTANTVLYKYLLWFSFNSVAARLVRPILLLINRAKYGIYISQAPITSLCLRYFQRLDIRLRHSDKL